MANAYVEDEELQLEGDLVLDLTDVSTEPVGDGWHTVRIKKATVVRTKETAKEPNMLMMRVQAQIIDPNDDDAEQYLFWNVMLQGKWRSMAALFWPSIGIPVGEAHTYRTVRELTDTVTDKVLSVRTKVRDDPEYGKSADVKEYREARVGTPTGLTLDA